MDPSIYTDPYSGIEILALSSRDEDGRKIVGACYDPRRTDLPVPWSNRCRHCLGSRQKNLSVHTKREVWTLSTERDLPRGLLSYTIPTYSETHQVTIDPSLPIKTAQISRRDSPPFSATLAENRLSYSDSVAHDKILGLCLRMLFSKRPATRPEITSVLMPLAQQPKRARGGRRLECEDVDWQEILRDLLGKEKP